MLYAVELTDNSSKSVFKGNYCNVALNDYIEKREFMKNKNSLIIHHLTGDITFDVYDKKDHHVTGVAKLIEK